MRLLDSLRWSCRSLVGSRSGLVNPSPNSSSRPLRVFESSSVWLESCRLHVLWLDGISKILVSVIALGFSVRPAGLFPFSNFARHLRVLFELGDHVQLEFQSIFADQRRGDPGHRVAGRRAPGLRYASSRTCGAEDVTIEKQARHERCSSPSSCTFHMLNSSFYLTRAHMPVRESHAGTQERISIFTSISYLDVMRHSTSSNATVALGQVHVHISQAPARRIRCTHTPYPDTS